MPFDPAVVQRRFPGRPIHWRTTAGSTMHEAARLAESGAPGGTVIGSEEQTAGYGRYGRPWHSEPAAGLYFTLILRLPLDGSRLPAVTLALGIATSLAIAETTGASIDLRWPNDVLIADRKIAGILVQVQGDAILAGIGINVNHTEFPADLAPLASSLRLATGKPHSREELLIALLAKIDEVCAILVREGTAPILSMFEKHSSYVRGRRVIVEEQRTGVTAGLTTHGFLILRKDDGSMETILAGGVRPLPDPSYH